MHQEQIDKILKWLKTLAKGEARFTVSDWRALEKYLKTFDTDLSLIVLRDKELEEVLKKLRTLLETRLFSHKRKLENYEALFLYAMAEAWVSISEEKSLSDDTGFVEDYLLYAEQYLVEKNAQKKIADLLGQLREEKQTETHGENERQDDYWAEESSVDKSESKESYATLEEKFYQLEKENQALKNRQKELVTKYQKDIPGKEAVLTEKVNNLGRRVTRLEEKVLSQKEHKQEYKQENKKKKTEQNQKQSGLWSTATPKQPQDLLRIGAPSYGIVISPPKGSTLWQSAKPSITSEADASEAKVPSSNPPSQGSR